MQIVVDKSYLESTSRDEIVQLCCEYDVIVISTLFYELLTTNTESLKKKCLPKFPKHHGAYSIISLSS